ncbi:MAG: DnaD domain protein [Ruminococcaceae bacterium]|nr:DnaD domain protein [Oscillospiraceae bacterium]
MGKTTKTVILYRNGNLPERLSDILSNADENDLRILVTLMMSADEDGCTCSENEISSLLETDIAEINASLKFWRGAGLISSKRKESKKTEKSEKIEKIEKKKDTETAEGVRSAHRGGVVAHTSIGAYESSELAELLETRKTLALFVNEAQRVLGKTLNNHDAGILIGIIDQLGFDEEAVLNILAYAVRLKHPQVRYAEKIAISFYDEGIIDTEAIVQKINRIEASAETLTQIRALFGMGSRGLSTAEKKLFTSWSEKLGYGIDVIKLAYDITIDTIHEPAPKYTNSILERWNAEGLHTAADIEEYIKSQKASVSKGHEKSYDTDEFFEASLMRSFEEFDKKYGPEK